MVSQAGSVWLCASSDEEKNLWMKDLMSEIATLKKQNEFYHGKMYTHYITHIKNCISVDCVATNKTTHMLQNNTLKSHRNELQQPKR